MTERIDTKAVLEKYRKWAETGGFMHQVFDHRAALLEVWDALIQEIADHEADRKRLEEMTARADQQYKARCGLVQEVNALEARIEALERVNRAWQVYFDADLEPPGNPHKPDPAVAAYSELQAALAALAAEEKP